MKWLIHLYPKKWKERYGEEFIYILEKRKLSFKDYLDIFVNAIDSRYLNVAERIIETNRKLGKNMNTSPFNRFVIFSVAIFLGIFGGYWLSQILPSILSLSPKLLLITGVGLGAFLGYIVGVVRGILKVVRMTQKEDIPLPAGKLIFDYSDNVTE